MPPTHDALKATEPFSLLSDEAIGQLREQALTRMIPHKNFLTTSGESWPYLMLVLSGAMEAVKESLEGRSLLVLTVVPGDVFWGVSFFNDDLKMPVSLRAGQDSELALWNREAILPILFDNPRTLWALTQLVIRRVQIASDMVDDLAFQPVAGRLAKLLLDQYPDHGPVARDLTLDEMAARVGSTREMVCRVLYRLSDDALIHITRTEFSLIDRSGLQDIAGMTRGRERGPSTEE
jgi:CRP/FNR family cyclic AMP-dependent transcriptional regulator